MATTPSTTSPGKMKGRELKGYTYEQTIDIMHDILFLAGALPDETVTPFYESDTNVATTTVTTDSLTTLSAVTYTTTSPYYETKSDEMTDTTVSFLIIINT